MDHVDSCVIGAGVVGLAIARTIAQSGRECLVLDSEASVGQGVSSRNSEVIHAGIYYPAGSLKAGFCVTGKALLYTFCQQRHIAFSRCGKLIVATEANEEATLEGILGKARANNVQDLELWSASKIADHEPQVRATLGLFSPSTGIVSAHELMNALLTDLEHAGGGFVGNTAVETALIEPGRFILKCNLAQESYEFSCRNLINACGLGAQSLATAIHGDAGSIPALHYCKGSYFSFSGKSPFSRLIYPVPEASGAGLGVHATIDTGGQLKFGPDVEYVDKPDYVVSMEHAEKYYKAIRRYFPGLKTGDLVPGYAGIRPKLQGPDDPPADFVIHSSKDHGVDRLIHLFGIESPGLTSSLAIAEHILTLLDKYDA